MRAPALLLASLLLAAAAACESAGPSGDELTITVTGEASLIAIGGTVQLTATARDGEGAVVQGLTFEWNTSNPAVATVSSSGLVTGAAGGTALITAGWRGSAGTKSISVIPAAGAGVGSVVLTAAEPLLAPGET
ncbi:MAG TPA: Ig-like domain-containing protein, partial [Gemmatimonadales bacterium]|nr:Ig-like domain-containing protein [Gemmatimonadales bacterium]